jgi:hypothetical protein
MPGVRLQTRDLSVLFGVQTGCGFHPAFIQWVRRALSQGVKRPGCEAGLSFPSSVGVKNDGAITALSQTSTWRSDYLIKHTDNFTFTLRFFFRDRDFMNSIELMQKKVRIRYILHYAVFSKRGKTGFCFQ